MQQLSHVNSAPVVDNTNSLTAGLRGPALLQPGSVVADRLARAGDGAEIFALELCDPARPGP